MHVWLKLEVTSFRIKICSVQLKDQESISQSIFAKIEDLNKSTELTRAT